MPTSTTRNEAPIAPAPAPAPKVEPEPAPIEEPVADDVIMEIDEVPARPKQERRDDRAERDRYAQSSRETHGYRQDEYAPRGPRAPDPYYQDGRYGFNDARQGPRYGGRERFGNQGRMYSDGMMRGGGGGRDFRR